MMRSNRNQVLFDVFSYIQTSSWTKEVVSYVNLNIQTVLLADLKVSLDDLNPC